MTQSTTPQGQLWYRLSDALGAHDPDPDETARVIDAFEAAGPDATWEDLPEDVRQLVEQIEQELPRTSWEDPSDVPDDTSHLDDPMAAQPEPSAPADEPATATD